MEHKIEFIINEDIERSCRQHIRQRFDTNLLNLGIRQQEMADRLNLDKAFISRMKNGIEVPDVTTRKRVCDFFNGAIIWKTEDILVLKPVELFKFFKINSDEVIKK